MDISAIGRSLQLSEFCLDHKIILVSFLPNMTHICQPMDVVVYGPVKKKWAQNMKEFRNSHRNQERMPKPTFCDLATKCVNEVLTPDLLKAAFVKTGLNPFDAASFNYSKLSTHVELPPEIHQNENTFSPETTFLGHLESLIKSNIPFRLEDFEQTNGQWLGDPNANELFLIWREAGKNIQCW